MSEPVQRGCRAGLRVPWSQLASLHREGQSRPSLLPGSRAFCPIPLLIKTECTPWQLSPSVQGLWVPRALQRPPPALPPGVPFVTAFLRCLCLLLCFPLLPPLRAGWGPGSRCSSQLDGCVMCARPRGGLWGVLAQWGASCDAHLLGAFLGLIGKVARLPESRQGEEGCGPAADLPLYLF